MKRAYKALRAGAWPAVVTALPPMVWPVELCLTDMDYWQEVGERPPLRDLAVRWGWLTAAGHPAKSRVQKLVAEYEAAEGIALRTASGHGADTERTPRGQATDKRVPEVQVSPTSASEKADTGQTGDGQATDTERTEDGHLTRANSTRVHLHLHHPPVVPPAGGTIEPGPAELAPTPAVQVALLGLTEPEPTPKRRPRRKRKADAEAASSAAWEQVRDAQRRYHPKYRGSAEDRRHVNARLAEGTSVEALLAIVDWTHLAPDGYASLLREGGYVGLSTTMKPTRFDERAEAAERWASRGRLVAPDAARPQVAEADCTLTDDQRQRAAKALAQAVALGNTYGEALSQGCWPAARQEAAARIMDGLERAGLLARVKARETLTDADGLLFAQQLWRAHDRRA